MPRILFSATLGCLLLATLHVAAQQPAGAPGPAPSAVVRATPSRVATPKGLLGTRPDVFSTIQGNALSSTNGALADATVRLRDARIGGSVGAQVTDKAGLFVFRAIDPGSYIVEIVGQDQFSVLAASQILNVSAGDAVSVIVKLPFRITAFAGVLGNSAPSAIAVSTVAAAAGVLATAASGTATCDTLQR